MAGPKRSDDDSSLAKPHALLILLDALMEPAWILSVQRDDAIGVFLSACRFFFCRIESCVERQSEENDRRSWDIYRIPFLRINYVCKLKLDGSIPSRNLIPGEDV